MKKISFNEMKIRTKKFKQSVYSLRKANIIIYYELELMNKIIFLERDEFEILLASLESFEITLIKNKKLEKFQYSVFQMKVENNKLIVASKNTEIKQEVTLKIDLRTNTKLIITKKIL